MLPRLAAFAALGLASLFVFLVLSASPSAVADGPDAVYVTNFPSVTQVEGRVGIKGPVRTAAATSLEETLVSPVPKEKTTNLVDGGVIDLTGFSGVVLSLAVETKGELGRGGDVGAILVPEEEVIARAFREDGETLFAMEVEAQLLPGRSYFASRQPDYTVSFPRYRVYYYNTTDKSVAATLFLYANGK